MGRKKKNWEENKKKKKERLRKKRERAASGHFSLFFRKVTSYSCKLKKRIKGGYPLGFLILIAVFYDLCFITSPIGCFMFGERRRIVWGS